MTKFSTALVGALAATASAHYTFPALVANGAATTEWQYVRMTTNHYSNGPVTDITSSQMRCYELDGRAQAQTLTVAAGSKVGFTVGNGAISHQGALSFWMAKAPSSSNAASFDGSGNVWFKIMEQGPVASSSGYTFPSMGVAQPSATIPANTPAGDYLIRIEHVALHAAASTGGAQFYISCGQIRVTGGGTGTPGPLVAIPGVYTGNEPGIKINIYANSPTPYQPAGPAPWTG